MIRTCLINSHDVEGGAARAAYRLHTGLRALQVDSHMYVQNKNSDGLEIHGPQGKLANGLSLLRPTVDMIPTAFYSKFTKLPWSVGWLPSPIIDKAELQNFDIAHLHWIGEGFLAVPFLKKIRKPLVWTLHDMWPFTGGCHYSSDCQRYIDSCGQCWELDSSREKDLSRWVWNRKSNHWRDLDLTIVTPSRWLAECARCSSLFRDRRIEVIPNGIDTHAYKPMDKAFCRGLLQLPQDRTLMLFGAMSATSDPRKGFSYLQSALKTLAEDDGHENIELLVFGASAPSNPPDLGFPVHYLGLLHDDATMAALYSAADVVIAPSNEDNLPNVVLEALACGTPCVAFDIGGLPDMIDHQKNGYLAVPFESEDLALGISWVLKDDERRQVLSANARAKVEAEFELSKISLRYRALYEELLTR